MSVTVETTHGKTSGSIEYYAQADPRIAAIAQRFREGKVDDRKVWEACVKITGMHRLETDWKEALAGKGLAGIDMYESWLDKQPKEYRRIYGSPDVIAAIIVKQVQKESE